MIKYWCLGIIGILFINLSLAQTQYQFPNQAGQYIEMNDGILFIPESSIPKPAINGVPHVHTNDVLFIPNSNFIVPETPASLACVYNFVTPAAGCNPNVVTTNPSGGWGTIAVVDAYDDPNAEADLNFFSDYYHLPQCTSASGCFTKVYQSGPSSAPVPCNTYQEDDWCTEISIDVQWAHAMAPNAHIVLVEANSSSTSDMNATEVIASLTVHNAGGGEISNSWGYPAESSDETLPYPNGGLDNIFQQYGDTIVYLASSGDRGAPISYPAASPYLISVGGTRIMRDAAHKFVGENGWGTPESYQLTGEASAGGPSLYEPRLAYQNLFQKIVGTQRGVPDIAWDADEHSGVLVCNSWEYGSGTQCMEGRLAGGTSLASPAMAGVINVANGKAISTQAELVKIYSNLPKHYSEYWRQIITGYNGYYAGKGYNFVTGVGTPIGYEGK